MKLWASLRTGGKYIYMCSFVSYTYDKYIKL